MFEERNTPTPSPLYSFLFPFPHNFPRLVGQGRRDVLCGVVDGLKTKCCIYALSWASGFMLVPLTFFTFPSFVSNEFLYML